MSEHWPRMAQGVYWQQVTVGDRWETFRRRITETDLVNFISVTGMLEAIFIDPEHEGAAMAGRPVPAALTYTFIEGFILQSILQGTGLALLEVSMETRRPVCVGDTIWARVETTDLRPTSRGDRAVVTSRVEVFNQRSETVLVYSVKRLLAGQPEA